jgi:hypothetical protein
MVHETVDALVTQSFDSRFVTLTQQKGTRTEFVESSANDTTVLFKRVAIIPESNDALDPGVFEQLDHVIDAHLTLTRGRLIFVLRIDGNIVTRVDLSIQLIPFVTPLGVLEIVSAL